jgi:hypothetical protein
MNQHQPVRKNQLLRIYCSDTFCNPIPFLAQITYAIRSFCIDYPERERERKKETEREGGREREKRVRGEAVKREERVRR